MNDNDDLAAQARRARQRDLDLYRARRYYYETFAEYPPVDLTVEEVVAAHIARLES